MIDQVMRDGRDPAVFLRDISYHIRTLLLAKCCPEEISDILDLTDEDAAEFRKQAEDFTVSRLMTILDYTMNAESEMRFSSSPRLTLENVCLKCCIRTGEADPQALNDRIDELEKKIEALNERIANGVIQLKTEQPVKAASPAEGRKTPAPKKEETGSGSAVTADIQKAWKEIMSRLSKEDPRIWGILTQGKISCDGTEVRWSPLKAEGSEYFVAPLNREEKKEEIIKCLKDVTGTEYSFIAAASAESQDRKADSNSDDAYISRLYETFGKEPVDIVDHL